MKVKVKICGITRKDDALRAVDLGAWALGFVFYPGSSRYITPEKAAKIIDMLDPKIKTIGVFVNPHMGEVRMVSEISGISTVQLHGNEDPSFCAVLPKDVIKAFRFHDPAELKLLKQYDSVRTYLMDSAKGTKWGGNGKLADWKLASDAKKYGQVILAGGLSAENVASAITQVEPFAIDLSTSVEDSPGKKSAKKLKELFAAIKKVA